VPKGTSQSLCQLDGSAGKTNSARLFVVCAVVVVLGRAMELHVLGQELNFLELEPEFSTLERSQIVIVPAPYEYRTSFGRGTCRGPEAILRASAHVEMYDEEFEQELCTTAGVATLQPVALDGLYDEAAIAAVEAVVEALLQRGKFVVTLGGEHTIALAPIRAHWRRYPQMSLLQLDAHADLRQEYQGSPYSHACVMARVAEFLPPERIVQVGIRALAREEAERIRQWGIRTFFAEKLRRGLYGERWYDQVVQTLSSQVYVTLDVDVFDPAIMPATGTPEPGGLWYHEVLELFRTLIRSGRRVVGIDIVEFSPIPGLHHAEMLVARLVYKLLNICFVAEERLASAQ
jgi:agmatinase